MERMQYCAANLCITFINAILTLLSDENHFFGKISVYCEDMHTPPVRQRLTRNRPPVSALSPPGKARSDVPKSLFRHAIRALLPHRKAFPTVRQTPSCNAEKPVWHNRMPHPAVPQRFYDCGKRWKPPSDILKTVSRQRKSRTAFNT